MLLTPLLLGVTPVAASQRRARKPQDASALAAADGLPTELALEAAASAGYLIPANCSVPSNYIWVVGTNHRTGSQMNNDLLRSIAMKGNAGKGKEHGEVVALRKLNNLRDDLTFKQGIYINTPQMASGVECVKSVKRGSICLVPHLYLEDGEQFQHLRRVASKKNAKLRLVNWVRDPLHVGRSAYMYHIRGPEDELWLHQTPSDNVAAILDACAGNGTNDLDPPHLVCQIVHKHSSSVRDLSYFRFLKMMDGSDTGRQPHGGFLTEMWRSLKGPIKQMQQTTRSLANASSQVAVTVDLDQAINSCDTEFQRVFGTLEGAPLDGCVKSGCDISTAQCPTGGHNAGPSCGKHSNIHHTTQTKEDAEMADSLEEFALGNFWFNENVQPVRKDMGYV